MPLTDTGDYITLSCDLQHATWIAGRRAKIRGLLPMVVVCLVLWLSCRARAQSSLPDAPSAVGRQAWADTHHDGGHPTRSSSHGSFHRLVERGLEDQREIYTAPFHRSALKWDIAVVAVTGGFIAADRHISGALSSDHLNVSRDISSVGLYGTMGAVGAAWFTGVTTHNPHAEETGYLGAEAFANSAVVYALMNVISGRQRPLEDSGKGHFFQNNTLDSSFPSGHAIIAWSGAAVLAHEYPKPWVKWLAYGTATAVSVTRMTSKQHFPADVVVGSTFGYLIGRHIFRAHCKPGLSAACEFTGQRP